MRGFTPLAVLATLALTPAAQAASVNPAELAQCAGIAAAEPRLACYDALAHRVAGGATAAPAPVPVAKASPPAPSPAGTAQVPTPAPLTLDDPKNFGLSLDQMKRGQPEMKLSGPKSISARINGIAPGAMGKARIVLDNDQTWDVLDDDGGLKSGLEVSIRKAALGSFLMSASHHLYRVHRVN